MTVFASAVASQNDHGYEAGRYVASQILAAFQAPPALLVAFISEEYTEAEVVRGIRSINNTVPLIGSGTARVITMAGVGGKSLGLLALRSDALTVSLALAKGLQSQPAATAERALAALPAAQGALSSLLVLGDGLAGSAAHAAALQAASTQMGAGCTLVGGAAGRAGVRAGNVFANDEVAADALAVALLQGAAAIGMGLAHISSSTNDAPGAARQAAQQAVAALEGAPVAAAIIVISGALAEASAEAGSPEVQAIREVIGGAAPFVGMYGPGVMAPENGSPGYHPQAVLVYAIGQA
jgi:hypothetical protein